LRGQRGRGAGVGVDQCVDAAARRREVGLGARQRPRLLVERRGRLGGVGRPRLVEHVRGAADRAVVGQAVRAADRQCAT